MSPQPLLEKPEPEAHLVQFYEADEHVLTQNVGRYLLEGLKLDEGLLVIAIKEHADAFIRELERCGTDPDAAVRNKRALFLDAEETLDRCMTGDQPDWRRFEHVIGTALLEVRSREDHLGCRAYGELVALLWKRGQFSAAIRLEEFWNKLLESGNFKLFCGYPIDVFGPEFRADSVNALLCAHTHVVSAGLDGDLESAVGRAMDDVLGTQIVNVRSEMRTSFQPTAWATVPAAEAGVLWIGNHVPEKADAVAARARTYYHGEKRFRALVENSADAISLIDAEGNVLYASASTTSILGYGPRELVGCNWLRVVHAEDVDSMGRTLEDVLATPRRTVHWQARLIHKSERCCWVEGATTNLLDDPDVRAIVSNYRDVTERKHLEEENEKRAQELARSNAELQDFAYVAAHDLREPLRTVAAYTQLLKIAQSDEERGQCADIIIGGVTRMATLLDDLLSLTQLEFDNSREAVELHRVVQQAFKNLDQAVRESGAALAIDPLPVVQAREGYLIEVFQNLISNAIKYRSVAPIEICVTSEAWEREWLIKVSDNGIGIAPKYHDQIFGLFKRLHGSDVPGTGLGLAICRKIVEGMGGKIWVDSKPGMGSTFCFTIPRDMTTDGSELRCSTEDLTLGSGVAQRLGLQNCVPCGGAAMESAKAFETGKQLIGSADSEISTLNAVASAGSGVVSVFPQHARLSNGMPEGMIATDEAGTIVYAHPAEERTFGFAPGELIGMHLADLSGYPYEKNDQHIREVFSELQSKGFWSGEWLNMSRDGTRFYSTASMHTAKLDGRMYFIRIHSVGACAGSQAAAYHLAALVESSDDAIMGRDLNGLIISWNSAAERMFGYSADEAMGRPLAILAVPGREDEIVTIFERIRKGESVKLLETVRRRKDGKEIDVSITVSPIRNAAGVVIGASTIARDITDGKSLEEATLRLAAIVDGSDDAIISKDLNGIIRSWNKAAEHIFGYSSAEVIGQPISLLAAPDRLNEMPEVLAKVRRGERIDHYETRRRRKDGKIIDISLTVSPIRTSSGRVIGASKIARDVSEHKRSQKALEEANAELRQSETQFRMLANAIPQLCWMAHADGSFFWFNDRWYEYTGMVRDQNEGTAWQTVQDPVTLPEMTVRWEAAVVSREPFEMVTRICGRTGAFRSFLTRALPLKDHGGRVVRWFGTSTDIEERKLIEDVLQKTNETLRRANADLAQFAYVAAHDLQEPLRTVVSFSQIVQRTCSKVLDPESAQNLEYVVNGARRMNQLISDLLSYSRTTAETGRTEQEVDLEQAFAAILTLLEEPIARENARIIHQPLPRILADASQMGQVFQNLLSNALKYHRDGMPPEIEVKAELDEENWLFSVRDNGQGFKMKYAQQIFGIFKRLHGKEVPGSGMGLAICKAVIERHGGNIWANSEVGHGTTVYFTVPNRTGRTNATQQVT